MAYVINKTDGTVFLIVQDSQIATTAGITMVGKNYAGYGEVVNENFVRIVENFADTNPPATPVVGQTWFDTINNQLKVYDTNSVWAISQGASGPVGYTGSAGLTGNVGYVGSEGPTGPIGPAGPDGYTGSEGAGFTGSQGNLGYTGSVGIQGNVGYTGSVANVPFDGPGQLTNDGNGVLSWQPILNYLTITSITPTSSIGQVGDTTGSIVFNDTYIYYCTQNYDGVSNIWKRLSWSVDTW